MTTVNAPTARADATAVWTGTEMIVWGGQFVSGGVTNYLDTGARYNPAVNTWQALPTNGAPTARFDHTAVWSGGEMIVWGGETQTGKTSSGARYQPAANQWIPLATTGAPSNRSQHTAAWAGTQMIVWGGFDGTNELANGACYHPVRDVWIATTSTNAPMARQRHTAVWSGTEMIVWAGRRFDGINNIFLDSAHAYTPARTLYLYLRP
jgi:N-acetylneuraminic acid mutarotase